MHEKRTNPEQEKREDWLSLKWWLQESPSEAVYRLKIIVLAFGFATAFAAANIVYALVI